jgi:hypothetical protein
MQSSGSWTLMAAVHNSKLSMAGRLRFRPRTQGMGALAVIGWLGSPSTPARKSICRSGRPAPASPSKREQTPANAAPQQANRIAKAIQDALTGGPPCLWAANPIKALQLVVALASRQLKIGAGNGCSGSFAATDVNPPAFEESDRPYQRTNLNFNAVDNNGDIVLDDDQALQDGNAPRVIALGRRGPP